VKALIHPGASQKIMDNVKVMSVYAKMYLFLFLSKTLKIADPKLLNSSVHNSIAKKCAVLILPHSIAL